MARTQRPTRLRLPDTLDGEFTGLIIGTYGAALDFAEAQLFRQLSKHTVSRLVLADDVQLKSFLATQPAIKRMNRSYVAAPVRSPRAHHPKFILLVGPDAGRLHVGSGNLSISGYTGPGECFTSYEWDSNDPESVAPFATVRELLELEIEFGWIDKVARDRVHDLLSAAPWIPSVAPTAGPVVHNLRRSMIDQLEDAVGGRHVHEVMALAPFHDKSSHAIKEILGRLGPDRFCLLVQDGMTRLHKGALGRELKKSGVEVTIKEARAASPYPNVLLHAKFVLVRADGVDVILQGSANLSAVAMCRSGVDANVEIANLLHGDPGSFDDLLSTLELTDRSDGLTSFTPDEDWGNEEEAEHVEEGPWEVCWASPRLTGALRRPTADHFEVNVAGAKLAVARQNWDELDDGWQFTLEFGEDAAGRIDRARSVELVAADGTTWLAYPYHVLSLLRLSASGHRADLLQEVGDLDLRDKELEELVAELDRVLIVDGRSLWRLAHPEEREADPEVDAPRVDYGELDWEKIGVLPQFRQYGSSSQRHLLAQTELGIVLQALTGRFKADVRAGGGESTEEVDEPDDLSTEQEAEDADLLDDVSDDADDAEADAGPKRLAPRQRVRRLWRNFVRRFVAGLSDADFVASVGSSVVVPSYIVFNHLCRRLRVVDLVDEDFLTEAQLRLWSFMWGTEASDGYVELLPDDERAVARKLLAEHEDLAVTLAAVEDAWCQVWREGTDVRPLRTVWRKYLESEDWVPESGALSRAAAVTLECDGDASRLFDDLFDLAATFQESERDGEIAACLGVSPLSIESKWSQVHRGGTAGTIEECEYLEIAGTDLSLEAAQEACAIWKAYEPHRRYFRVQAENAVAILDLEHNDAVYFDKRADTEKLLDVGSRSSAPWEVRLEQLLDAA